MNINETQRNIGIGVAVIMLLMLLYPPCIWTSSSGREVPHYMFIWSMYTGVSINFGLLILQWIGVGIAGGIFFFLSKDSK